MLIYFDQDSQVLLTENVVLKGLTFQLRALRGPVTLTTLLKIEQYLGKCVSPLEGKVIFYVHLSIQFGLHVSYGYDLMKDRGQKGCIHEE